MTTCIRDLELAKRQLFSGYSAACARGGVVIDKEVGKRLIPAFKILERVLLNAPARSCEPLAFADKVIGLAAFRLAYLSGARLMWGEMASSLAVLEGKKRGVPVYYHRLVPSVMNASLDDLCPMEHLAFVSLGDFEFFDELRKRIMRVR